MKRLLTRYTSLKSQSPNQCPNQSPNQNQYLSLTK